MADDRLACCLSASMIATKSDKVESVASSGTQGRALVRGVERWAEHLSPALLRSALVRGGVFFFCPRDRKGRRDHTHPAARCLLNPPEPEKPEMKPPKFEIISDGVDIFVVTDGVKIAKRGSPDTPHASMSDLAEMKAYVADGAREHGHDLGGWRRVGTRDQPRHEAKCKTCGGLVQVVWDRDQRLCDVWGSPMSHAC
jgi:hypothetical protein